MVAGDRAMSVSGIGYGAAEERPHPEAQAEVHVGAGVGVAGGDDVQHRQIGHDGRVVKGHPVGAARTAIVAGHREAVVPELIHNLDLVESDCAHGVGGVVVGTGGLAAGAIAAEVCGDDRELLGQRRGDVAPHQMGLGNAVHEQQGWALAATTSVNGRSANVDVESAKPSNTACTPWTKDPCVRLAMMLSCAKPEQANHR